MMRVQKYIYSNGNSLKRISVILLCFIMASNSLCSQEIVHGITMSSVGVIGNLSNNSMPIHFTSKNECINIQNGVAVLIGDRSMGQFVINCKKSVKLNTLGAILYPNPIVNKTTLRFTQKPLFDEDFVLTVWSVEGNSLLSERVKASELVFGKVIYLSGLVSGTYLITVESGHYTEAIKFIKAN